MSKMFKIEATLPENEARELYKYIFNTYQLLDIVMLDNEGKQSLGYKGKKLTCTLFKDGNNL
jgi:hypothetical protein